MSRLADIAAIAATLKSLKFWLVDIAHWQAKGFWPLFLLRHHESDVVLGGAGLMHPDDWPSHELTWWLMPQARGYRSGDRSQLCRHPLGL